MLVDMAMRTIILDKSKIMRVLVVPLGPSFGSTGSCSVKKVDSLNGRDGILIENKKWCSVQVCTRAQN